MEMYDAPRKCSPRGVGFRNRREEACGEGISARVSEASGKPSKKKSFRSATYNG